MPIVFGPKLNFDFLKRLPLSHYLFKGDILNL